MIPIFQIRPFASSRPLRTGSPAWLAAGVLVFGVLGGCGPVGPNHSVPLSEAAAAFKGEGASEFSSRLDTSWWRIFSDAKLNELMGGLEGQNFDLRAAYARRNQAYAALGIDRSELYPQLLSSLSGTRNRATESERFRNSGGGSSPYYDSYRAGLSLSYELDLWGRVRRLVEAGTADLNAAEFSTDQVRLSLQTQLARSYFALRSLDSERQVLEEAMKTREQTLQLTQDRFDAGATSELDVARAKSEQASTRAQLVALEAPRAELENAIAVLVGRNPSNFALERRPLTVSAPKISAGAPARLLGRRPDVFIAERNLAAANARIGVATANFYPRVSLISTAGLSAVNSGDFLNWSSREFSIGPQVDLPLFQGGRRKAALELTRAQYDEALANYQQTVVQAYGDVENALAARSGAENEISAQQASVSAAQRTFDLSDARYTEGISSYLDVVDSQRELLNAQRTEVQARSRSFEATVQLIQALGGGFAGK